jgi:uncharacterized protein YwgA
MLSGNQQNTIPLKYVALKTIQAKGHAYNEDITKVVLAAQKEGVPLGGINYHYTPGGPCSPEVQTVMSMLLDQAEIEELSPAKITPKGFSRLQHMEKAFQGKTNQLDKVILK